MAIYRTDRDRRIIGDRVVAKEESFAGVNKAVEEVWRLFVEVHAELQQALESRQREKSEDAVARQRRAVALERAFAMYRWAYAQLAVLAQPDWDDPPADDLVAELRERLFPLGAPHQLGDSAQMVLDGMTHLLSAAGREEWVSYPQRFMEEAASRRAELSASIGDVSREELETRNWAATHATLRKEWDKHYRSLRDVTGGFLWLADRSEEMASLFRGITRPSGRRGERDDDGVGPEGSGAEPGGANDPQ